MYNIYDPVQHKGLWLQTLFLCFSLALSKVEWFLVLHFATGFISTETDNTTDIRITCSTSQKRKIFIIVRSITAK